MSLTDDRLPQDGSSGTTPSGADCKQWLEGAISWLNSYQPQTLIVVADSLPGNNQAIGKLGFIELLKALDIPGRRLIVMGPQPTGNVYGGAPCLSAHPSNIQTCGAPLAQLVNPTDFSAVKNSALSVGATYINPVPWMCTATTCPPVIDSYPVQEDPSHITSSYADYLAPVLQVAAGLSNPS